MRAECNLPNEMGPRDPRPPAIDDLEDREKARLVELSDALAFAAIEQSAEVALNASSLGVLWGKLGRPNPLNEQSGRDAPPSFSRRCWIRAYGPNKELRLKVSSVTSM